MWFYKLMLHQLLALSNNTPEVWCGPTISVENWCVCPFSKLGWSIAEDSGYDVFNWATCTCKLLKVLVAHHLVCGPIWFHFGENQSGQFLHNSQFGGTHFPNFPNASLRCDSSVCSCFSLQWFIPLVMNDGSFPPNICFSVAYYWRWYYEVQNIERSGGDCSHCLSTSDLWGLNLIEIIESSLHYQKWPLQHGKTLGKVFFANLLINAADQPEALKVVEIILGKIATLPKKRKN